MASPLAASSPDHSHAHTDALDVVTWAFSEARRTPRTELLSTIKTGPKQQKMGGGVCISEGELVRSTFEAQTHVQPLKHQSSEEDGRLILVEGVETRGRRL